MKPVTISEKMLYNTVQIRYGDQVGTAFFFSFEVDGNNLPVLITNKHVISYQRTPRIKVNFHLATGELSSDQNFELDFVTDWYFHSEKDLCFCFARPLFGEIENRTGKKVFYSSIVETDIANQAKLDTLSALEELTMVGYPIGICDTLNNFPVFRKGYTASHPNIDFNKKGIGLADMACFPGSSGSPILILNENGYREKSGAVCIGGVTFHFFRCLVSNLLEGVKRIYQYSNEFSSRDRVRG